MLEKFAFRVFVLYICTQQNSIYRFGRPVVAHFVTPNLVGREMIKVEKIHELIDAKLEADGCFIVELTVSADNDITLVVDSNNGVSIDYCIEMNRLFEGAFDREVEDYSLEVSSAGIGCEFKVLGQYKKNIGNDVEVTYPNGSHIKGKLLEADEAKFIVETSEMVKVEGQKKKQLVTKQIELGYSEVKNVKDIISFK